MKKISKLLLIFVLFFVLGISSVSAEAMFTATSSKNLFSLKGSDGQTLLTYNWYSNSTSSIHKICANEGRCKEVTQSYWNFYSVHTDDGKDYILYCLNMDKDWANAPMNQYGSIDNILDYTSLPKAEKDRRIALLKQLLLFGDNEDPYNSTNIYDLIANDPHCQIRLIAMQSLVWEIIEGGRTSFDTIEPDWNGPYSIYKEVVYPNGGSTQNRVGTIYYYYKKYINDAKLGEQKNPATAFNKNYVLGYNQSTKNYKKEIAGLGDYLSCESADNDVKVNVNESRGIATVTTSKNISSDDPVKITCKYYRGTGVASSGESFIYFRFKNADLVPNYYQDMVYGNGYKVFEASFNVSTENTDFAIKKVDADGKELTKVKFILDHVTNTSYRNIEIQANTDIYYSLRYSGEYTVSEIADTVPKGYERLPDFKIKIDGISHKLTKCDGQRTNNSGDIVSCLNNQVGVEYSGNTLVLRVINTPKNFKIMKVDSKGNSIKGAEFELLDSKNNPVKFKIASGNIYTYDTAGTVTVLSNASLPSYPISLLPEGEYSIVEKSVPYPYSIPTNDADRITKIKINSKRNLLVFDSKQNKYVASTDATVRITNYTTKFTIHKVGNGSPLEGVQFELYNGDKTAKLKANMTSSGVYNYVDDQSTVENYVYITNSNGDITINNIPAGIYWIKEVATIPPYVLPTGNAVYTQVEVKVDSKGVSINNSYNNNTIEISNTPNSFNFYKKDTDGNPLTTGKYKLQKYDKDLDKYVDLKLVEVKNDGTYNANTVLYKVDEKNGKIQFTLTKGMATFIDMESSSTYRIIETVAPEGYTKASTKDTATVYIDEYGNASGLLVLIDQKIVKEDDSAYAELIINIQTGKQRIMYAAVIVLVIGIIVGLIVYNKRK